MKRFLWQLSIVSLILLTFGPALALAQTRSYSYSAIGYSIKINKDTTFDVSEAETYRFNGEYHQAERSIPLNKISAITDISVADALTGQPYTYSSQKLDKTLSSSWGKYTYYTENGMVYIDWYYNVSEPEHTWLVNYKVHGGIGFYKDHDELYWNLFTNYSVPIKQVQAIVTIPTNTSSVSNLQSHIYTKYVGPSSSAIQDDKTFVFKASDIAPQGIVTIAAGWPKGIVDQKAFWKDWLWLHWPMLFLGIIIIAFIAFENLWWYFNYYRKLYARTIVPEYEPPQQLRPAELAVMYSGRSVSKLWAATIVDLAVRGYVKISEDDTGLLDQVSLLRRLVHKEYFVDTLKSFQNDQSLKDFEQDFLQELIGGSGQFSTRQLNHSGAFAQQEFAEVMRDLQKELYKTVQTDTEAYTKTPTPGSTAAVHIFGFLILLATLFGNNSPLDGIFNSIIAPIIGLVVVVGIALYQIYLAPQMTEKGFELKRQILGFKLYLQTAERDRLQHLTPDLFEKYLPYAMIYGIEREWAQAFDSFNLQAPNWYTGSAVGMAHGMNSSNEATAFSASAFSASFSSSFASAFGTSTGSGGAGGGGSAGGGGGGGGGGAS